jgi:diguanylate cyclase (GGDEF)-like protein
MPNPAQQRSRGVALSTQLSMLLIVLALATFFTSVVVSTSNMRAYLDTQLSRTAQDTAYSLGLSIAPYVSGDEAAMADTMVSAIFDSGYYLQIRYTTVKKQVLFDRQNPLIVEGVPSWFVDLFSLVPPVMKTEVNDGWRIAGELSVQSHPGVAYLSLWQHTKGVFWSSLILCILALIAVHILLLFVLKPLKDIEHQALLLSQKRFEFLNYLPLTKELRTVVYALNNMVSNVKRSFAESAERAEQLNQQVFIDALTGLPNRRALHQSFASLEREADASSPIYIGLVTLGSLKYINDHENYSVGDQYVLKAASLLQAQVKNLHFGQLFRIAGGDFVILAELGQASSNSLAENLQQAFEIATSDNYPNGFATAVLLPVRSDDDLGTALSRLDAKLAKTAQNQRHSSNDETSTKKRSDWQDILAQFTKAVVADTAAGALNTDLQLSADMVQMFTLEVQPVYQADHILYVETFVKFKANGEQLASSDVFAMAERLGVSLLLDKALVSFILSQLVGQKQHRFAINLSKSAMHDEQFVRWLSNTLKANKEQLPDLIIEVNEQAILGAVGSAYDFFKAMQQIGVAITIERFGASFTSFRYLQGLNINFIKIDGSYIRALDSDDTSKFFVQTMTQICHGIGISVIATHVESAITIDICQQLHIDALQGHGLHRPVNFSDVATEFGCNFTKHQLQSN